MEARGGERQTGNEPAPVYDSRRRQTSAASGFLSDSSVVAEEGRGSRSAGAPLWESPVQGLLGALVWYQAVLQQDHLQETSSETGTVEHPHHHSHDSGWSSEVFLHLKEKQTFLWDAGQERLNALAMLSWRGATSFLPPYTFTFSSFLYSFIVSSVLPFSFFTSCSLLSSLPLSHLLLQSCFLPSVPCLLLPCPPLLPQSLPRWDEPIFHVYCEHKILDLRV